MGIPLWVGGEPGRPLVCCGSAVATTYLGELGRDADGSSYRLLCHLWHLRGRENWQLWALQNEVAVAELVDLLRTENGGLWVTNHQFKAEWEARVPGWHCLRKQ